MDAAQSGWSHGEDGTQSLRLTEESSEADSSGRGMPARHESPAGRGGPPGGCWWRPLGPGDARSSTKCTASGLLPVQNGHKRSAVCAFRV